MYFTGDKMIKPKITAMIQARTPDRIFELIEKGIEGGADAFGIQVEQIEYKYRTEEIFKQIFTKCGEKTVYITNYRNNLNTEKSDNVLAEELLKIADFGAELFDVPADMFAPCDTQITYDESAIEKQKELIAKLHKKGKRVLMSSHTGLVMSYDEIYSLIREQKSRGADVAKIVSVSKTYEDELSCIETSARLAREGITDFLFLTGGEYHKLHRRTAPLIAGGMFLCVAEYDELATKAQPLLSDVKNIVDVVYYAKENNLWNFQTKR